MAWLHWFKPPLVSKTPRETYWKAAHTAERALIAYAVAWQVWNSRGQPAAELPLLHALHNHAETTMQEHDAALAALGHKARREAAHLDK